MNAAQLIQDMNDGCLTEVETAGCFYYDQARGLTVRQQFFIYPNDTIACLNSVDGGASVLVLHGDDDAIFRSRHPEFFA